MLFFPNAKINIGLSIIRKRMDGYHDIETVFYPIGLSDAMEFQVLHGKSIEEKHRFNYSGIEIPGNNDICRKVISLLEKIYEIPSLDIHIHKNIPVGGGLGGGSSDATFFLKNLSAQLLLGISSSDLELMAASIGSDCPFFIRNSPSLATGRGDMLEDIPLRLKNYYLIIVCPEIKIDTATAYSQIIPSGKEGELSLLVSEPVTNWKNTVINQFEESVFSKFPVLGEIKNYLYSKGAIYASMSGSGSAIYALFNQQEKLPELDKKFKIYTELL